MINLMSYSLQTLFPWILVLFVLLAFILIAISLRFRQLSLQRSKSLKLINQNLRKELNIYSDIEKEKKNLETALLQGQKLQAIGTLAGGIAHDFNNILYAIIGYTEMAREDIDKGSLIYRNLGKVLEASQRGQELISRILAFSRREHTELKIISINITLESVLGLLRPTIPTSVMVNFFPLEEDILILGDQTQLHQIFVNIINNAVNAMDNEGTITIKLEPIIIQDKKYCKMEISDTGHGMEQSTMSRIFEPFYTTKEVGKGTGLGLSMVHTIITEHKGKITVNSQIGEGTTFTILLPEYSEPSKQGE